MAKQKRTRGQEKPTPPTTRKSTRNATRLKSKQGNSSRSAKGARRNTSLTENIDDLTVLDTPSPMITDTENFDNQNQIRRAIDEKLLQAGNFLSDEGAHSHPEFTSRLEDIDEFLQLIAAEKIKYDTELYDKIQAAVEVHRSRINRQKVENIKQPNNPHLQSKRLSLLDTSERGRLRGAPLRPDHPPFTLERPADQNLFIKALHGPPAPIEPGVKDRQAELLDIEHAGFLETLSNPSLVHERLEENELQTRDQKFNIRARKRGRQRAAVRMALRSFATNVEQHYEGRWATSDFRLPAAPAVKLSGRKVNFKDTTSVQKNGEQSISWTQKYRQFIRAQVENPEGKKEGTLRELARPLNGNKSIATDKEAMDLLRAVITKESQEDKKDVETTTDKDWNSPPSKADGEPQYFSLNRWSGTSTLGRSTHRVGESPPVQEKIQAQGKPQLQKSSQQGRGLSKPGNNCQEKFFRGESTFGFAETPFLQAVTSKWIENDLASGKSKKAPTPIYLPSHKFSLPEPVITPEAADISPTRGHARHLRHNAQRQAKLRSGNVTKSNVNNGKISKPAKARGGAPSKKKKFSL